MNDEERLLDWALVQTGAKEITKSIECPKKDKFYFFNELRNSLDITLFIDIMLFLFYIHTSVCPF